MAAPRRREPDADQRGGKSDKDADNKRTIPNTKANRSAIIDRIENKLGPVGKGHHESHRRAHLSEWLAQKGKKK